MKKLIPALLALAALMALPALAAKRIQYEATDLTKNVTSAKELLLDAMRFRMNDGKTSIMFLTQGGSRMVILDKDRNEYYEMDEATMAQMGKQVSDAMAQMEQMMKGMPPEQRAMMEQIMKGKMGAALPAAPAPTTYTAKGAGTVNGFRCTNYDGMKSGQKVSEICAAQPGELKINPQDFQVMEKMREYAQNMMSSLQNSPLGNMFSGGVVASKGVDGFPVRTTSFTNGKAVSREELKSVADATFTDADFSTGTAKKIEMPGAAALKGKAKGR